MTPQRGAGPAQQFPELAALTALLSEGRWLYPLWLSQEGPLAGVREGPVVTETIIIESPQVVTVARMFTQDWILSQQGRPHSCLWHFTGSLGDAVSELRALPQHDRPGAPRVRKHPPSGLWIPRRH